MNLRDLARKTNAIEVEPLGADENPFSTNKVTGHSLNFPIAGTCNPSEVCANTCYFACGPSTWTASLAKQKRLQARLDADPRGLADQIVAWARRLRLDFIRWNGGGDLTRNSPQCIDRVATSLPDVPQWVVSRKIALAALVVPRPSVYLHLSIDRSSMDRLEAFAKVAPDGLQWFWSYQCDSGETPPDGPVAPVVFFDHYKPARDEPRQFDCPLNWREDISGVCGECRWCFDGRAVAAGKSIRARQTALE